MLVDTPQICWHGGEGGKAAPILSLDTHPLALDQTRGENPAGAAGARFILATAGTDAEVRLWVVNQPTREEAGNWEQPGLSGRMQSFVASLGGHQRGVNVVRFSPDGLSLASASDGGTVVIWSVETLAAWSTLSSDRDTKKTILRGATEDIYDMSWSPDSRYLACGSIDRRAHIWEVTTKRSIATLEDHANYVQGTAWDPLSKYMATQSSDRSCRVYHITHDGSSGSSGAGRLGVKCCNVIKSCLVAPDDASGEAPRVHQGSTVSAEMSATVYSETGAATTVAGTKGDGGSRIDAKGTARVGAPAVSGALAGTASGAQDKGNESGKACGGNEGAGSTDTDNTRDKVKPVQRKNLFVDETVTSFFRRLCWSPDGAFLITPTAQHWDAATKKTQFCTYLFTRGQFVKPAVCLPGLNKPSVAVRCNPRLFTLKRRADGTESESTEPPMCDLPYRAVFAVVSLDAVVVYDTEHAHPLTVATGLHYSGLTDACWSSNGLSLFVSSTDGYVSKIHFEQEELGSMIPESDVPSQTRRLHPVIYGWTDHAEEAASRIPTASPRSISDECQASTPREKGDDPARTQESGEPAGPDTMAAKPKKKIVPTLVTPGHPAQGDVGPVPSTAVPPSPTLPSAERKKRRITPTLVHGASGTEDGRAMPAGTQGDVSSTPTVGEEAPHNTLSAATHASGSGLDQTSKKKRLAPTLVSAL